MKSFMKKIATIAFTTLTFALILIMLTACAGQEGGAAGPEDSLAIEDEVVEDNGVEEDIDAAEDNGVAEDIDIDLVGNGDHSQAHAMYLDAGQAMQDAGSVLVTSVTNTTMHMDDQITDSVANSTLAMVFHGSDDFDMKVEIVSVMDTDDGPLEIPMTTYYRDGTVYINIDGEGMRVDMPMEYITELADSNNGLLDFDETSILMQVINETADGTELSFVLDFDVMSEMVEEMLAGMGRAPGDAMDGDVELRVLLDDNGDIETVNMWMSAVSEEEGEVTFALEMHQASVFEIGGVTIDFPDYLDDFEDYEDL